MNDIDQTNVYSYKGKGFCADLTEYLKEKCVPVLRVELACGTITVHVNAREFYFPQYASWLTIADKTEKWMK